jgi:hypothetical protein
MLHSIASVPRTLQGPGSETRIRGQGAGLELATSGSLVYTAGRVTATPGAITGDAISAAGCWVIRVSEARLTRINGD